jgi:hypothetical protein
MITLDPVRQPLPAMRTWIVRGTKTLPDGGEAVYTGTSWGRDAIEARARHERLMDIDKRTREALSVQGDGLDITGYTLTFHPAPAGF